MFCNLPSVASFEVCSFLQAEILLLLASVKGRRNMYTANVWITGEQFGKGLHLLIAPLARPPII